MTRKEKIEQQALLDEDAYADNNYHAFKRGVAWADEHPNLCEEEQVGMNELGMMWQKQALIKKACEWLENCAVVDIEEFKKAMEE